MAWRSFSKRALAAATFVLIGALASACGSNRAWLVKPHQREYLADRIMRPDSNALESSADQHVLNTREGAIGGGGTVGGGCGCN
ncbi:MAG: DUF4266 domain-containing protein [Deltaproteobacteria bacterium]|nr:DUF4266 domain-containing protein [Deltaproteobacteria bacterium]